MKKILITITIILMAAITGCSALSPVVTHTPTATRPAAPTEAVGETPSVQATLRGSTQREVTYCTIRQTELKLDLYYPRSGEEPFPVVVYIHGGGWSIGDKAEVEGSVGALELMERGYALASINYRLAPSFRFPSMIEDVKCALRYLKANAGQWSLDAERMGVMGASAGGHLASLAGSASEDAGWDSGKGYDEPYLEEDSRVQAVVNLFGPANLQALFSKTAEELGQSVFGVRKASDPFLAQASPVTYISPDDPPVLILQGTEDEQTPPEQAQMYEQALKEGGVDTSLVLVEGAGHGFPAAGGYYSPGFEELSKKIADFFDRWLKQ